MLQVWGKDYMVSNSNLLACRDHKPTFEGSALCWPGRKQIYFRFKRLPRLRAEWRSESEIRTDSAEFVWRRGDEMKTQAHQNRMQMLTKVKFYSDGRLCMAKETPFPCLKELRAGTVDFTA